jgi:hypothetical protein
MRESLVLPLVPLAVLLTATQVADPSVSNGYRNYQRDGANCVSLLLRLWDSQCPVSLPTLESLTDVAVQLRNFRMRAYVYQMKTDDLSKIPSPSIVLSEGADSARGRMQVYLGMSDSGRAVVFDGATCNVSAIPPDRFLRSFTGRGVVVPPPGESMSSIVYCERGVAGMVVIASALFFLRRLSHGGG